MQTPVTSRFRTPERGNMTCPQRPADLDTSEQPSSRAARSSGATGPYRAKLRHGPDQPQIVNSALRQAHRLAPGWATALAMGQASGAGLGPGAYAHSVRCLERRGSLHTHMPHVSLDPTSRQECTLRGTSLHTVPCLACIMVSAVDGAGPSTSGKRTFVLQRLRTDERQVRCPTCHREPAAGKRRSPA